MGRGGRRAHSARSRRVVRRLQAGIRHPHRGRCCGTARCCRSTRGRIPTRYLHRSHPSDVARTEQLTFISTRERDDAGPTNNWMSPADAKSRAGGYLRGAMRGRTMYVIPYLMGPGGSSMSRVGIMVTDSAYVVASMHIMTRVGDVALQAHAERRRFHRRPALPRRSLTRPSADPALPRGEADLERGLGLRRQRAARQEVPRAAAGLGAGARGGLAGRAHADHRRRGSGGPGDLPGRRHAERVGQDEPRHGGLAPAGLARVDGGRRHRLAPRGQDRSAPRRSTPSAASSAWRRIPAPTPIPTPPPWSARTRSSPTWR